MDRKGKALFGRFVTALLAAVVVLWGHGDAAAQSRQRIVYNPVTKQTEPERVARRAPRPAPTIRQAAIVEPDRRAADPAMDNAIELAGHHAACGCDECGGGVPACDLGVCDATGCGDVVCGDSVGGCGGVCGPVSRPANFYAGFEFTFVKPRFESNVAFTVTEDNGAGSEVISDTEFDYDLVLTPRVFLGWKHCDGVGLRATWWHFDNDADVAAANPPANGFGSIDHPPFGAVDIGSTVPTDNFSATSHLNAYTIDLEATKETCFCGWDLGVAGGVRYAFAEQGYLAELSDTNDVLLGSIDYLQSIEGFGPTISLSASRPLTQRASLFCNARGSVLFGDGESRLEAGEDLDLTVPLTTNRATNRDDVLSIAEIQLGFRWQGGDPCYTFRPFVTMAMEGQVWNGAGSATSEDGTLGFFGFASRLGVDW